MRYTRGITGWLFVYFVLPYLFGLSFSNNAYAESEFLSLGGTSNNELVTATPNNGRIRSLLQDLNRLITRDSNKVKTQKFFPIPESECGNNILEDGEECDGNKGIGEYQGCSENCKLVLLEYCGDGIINRNEGCDDGNTENDDGCSSLCAVETDSADERLYDLGRLPYEYRDIHRPAMPKIAKEVGISSVEQFNMAASQPMTRIRVGTDLQGDNIIISASDIEVIVEDGIHIDALYINNDVKRIRIRGGHYSELNIKAPVSFWPEYNVYSDRVVEDVIIENVTVKSKAYYAFFGMARRLAVLNSKFRSESSNFISESPEGVKGEDYIIAGNKFYSRGSSPNISIFGADKVLFVDNLIINDNAFNRVNLEIDRQSEMIYIGRNKFVGTGISLSNRGIQIENNIFHHSRGILFDAPLMGGDLTVVDNIVFSDLTDCLVCDSYLTNWTVSNNSIYQYKKPEVEPEPDLEQDAIPSPQRAVEPDVELAAAPSDVEFMPGIEPGGLRPFFIGHSLLNVWIPKMIDDIADSLGKNNIYIYDETYLTGTGASLSWHYNHPYDGQGADPLFELIQPGKYDALVLTDAIPVVDFKEETKEYALRFYQVAMQGNLDIDLFLFSTWVHKDSPRFSEWNASLEQETAAWEEVRDYLAARTGRKNIYIIPGGLALKRLLVEADAGRVPGLENGNAVFEDDMIHLNALGNYFMSLVHAATLYRIDPTGATHVTSNPWGGENRPLPSLDMAKKMQAIAWEVVSNYPFSGVTASNSVGYCGNGIIEPEEACDDGNRRDGDGCTSVCTLEINSNRHPDPVCGNGVTETEEACDDGNLTDDDGCSSDCMIEEDDEPAAVCGNGVVESEEVCDDGNTLEGDGCSSECSEEVPREPTPIAVCGNNIVEFGEDCDDGNQLDGDECSSTCMHADFGSDPADIGLNLNWNYNDIQQWMFVDAMKYARPWRTRGAEVGEEWDTEMSAEIQWRSDGYPVEVPFDTGKGPQVVFTVLLYNHELAESSWPAGEYSIFFEGEGELAFGGDAVLVGQSPGYYRIAVQPRSFVELQITRSKHENPVRNIRVIMPGFEKAYASNPFHPLFLERLGGVAALRFTDTAMTDSHPNGSWNRRVTPRYFSQGTERGVALEYLVQLANRTRKDAWFNLPHGAEDDYVKQFAIYLRDHLDPTLTIYIEYSNELWNEAYGQFRWIRERGCRDEDTFMAGIDSEDDGVAGCDDFAAGIRAAAKRMAEVLAIVDDVFKGHSQRVVKVMGGSTESYEYNEGLWNHFNDPGINPAGISADAFAIAPCFGRAQELDDIVQSEGGGALSVNAILELAANDLRSTVARSLDFYADWARTRNLQLLAYEAGNCLTYTTGGPELARKVENASRHPRMGELYLEFIERWRRAGGKLLMISNYVGLPGIGDTRGILEYQDQLLDQAYMYQAVMIAAGDSRIPAICGDGVLQAWEGCDDGNKTSGDRCSKYCTKE